MVIKSCQCICMQSLPHKTSGGGQHADARPALGGWSDAACVWLMTLMPRYRRRRFHGIENAFRAASKSALHILCQGLKVWVEKHACVAWLPGCYYEGEMHWEEGVIDAVHNCPSCVQARAVRKLLAHRLSGESAERAKAEWYEVVEGDHSLWDGVSEPYKHTIRAFLVYFHSQIQRHSTERFNFRNGSVGAHPSVLAQAVPARPLAQARDALHGMMRFNVSMPSRSSLHTVNHMVGAARECHRYPLSPTLHLADAGNFFFAGARLFFRSLEAAIFLFSRVARIPEGSLVLPAICTEERITLGAEMANGTVIRGQNEISHPSAPGAALLQHAHHPTSPGNGRAEARHLQQCTGHILEWLLED